MNGGHPFDRNTLRAEAAHWYNQRLAGDMTRDDEGRFNDWLDQSEAHLDAYRSVGRAWFIAGSAMDDPVLSEPAPVERRSMLRWRGLALAASLLLAIVASGMMFPGLMFDLQDRPVQAFQTETGQRSTITLPDGSVVTLDSETEMRFADKPEERLVKLVRGRAFFEVAKNHSRPFVVNAGGKRVRAVGTAFGVRVDQGEVTVVLAEGKVRVEEAGETGNGADMTPGRQLVVGTDQKWTVTSVDVQKETSWTEGRLIFLHDPLSKAITEVNRYSTRKLVFKDGAIPDKRIVGVFSTGDVDGFVKALELNGIARPVSTSADKIIIDSQ
ncbi:FecR domain-containing protein [Sandaracinobacter sp. RS1-74]|uniref:FecR family protein n=1 Tax=Sandaracinobacteroides sayramensis TaxID=2913411 RepID=UPI001EDA42ED|nr:FecR domain-containing protein [Sandaracinobacteroides sayramensis]MCG2840129.1 FecR domain-containing protein [Sandaracinobacteroides sayramensis]